MATYISGDRDSSLFVNDTARNNESAGLQAECQALVAGLACPRHESLRRLLHKCLTTDPSAWKIPAPTSSNRLGKFQLLSPPTSAGAEKEMEKETGSGSKKPEVPKPEKEKNPGPKKLAQNVDVVKWVKLWTGFWSYSAKLRKASMFQFVATFTWRIRWHPLSMNPGPQRNCVTYYNFLSHHHLPLSPFNCTTLDTKLPTFKSFLRAKNHFILLTDGCRSVHNSKNHVILTSPFSP